MDWFNMILDNYLDGFYTKEEVYKFVEYGQINNEEYNNIINNK